MATKLPAAGQAAPLRKPSSDEIKQIRHVSERLKQISDATRLQIVLLLNEEERHVGNLVAELNSSQPAISHHLSLMRHGKIVTSRRQGKFNFYRLTDFGRTLATVVMAVID